MLSVPVLGLLGPSIAFAVSLPQQLTASLHARDTKSSCRCYPGDKCWPTVKEWATFNKTIGGKLVATVPLAAPCHNDVWEPYNNATCAALQAAWLEPGTQ